MNLDALLTVALLAVSVLVSTFLAIRVATYFGKPGAPALFLIIASVGLWSLGYAFEIMMTSLGLKTASVVFQYIWIALLPLGVVLFFIPFSGHGAWLTRVRIGLLSAIPVVTILVSFTSSFHGLMYNGIHLPATAYGPLKIDHGVWFYIHSVYSYALLLFSAGLAFIMTFRGAAIYRTQARLMLAALLVPWVSNILYLAGYQPFGGYDLTPLAFTLSSILMEVAFSRFGLLERMPVAYEAVLKAMKDAVIVINEKDTILEVNPAGRDILKGQADPVGRCIQDFFPSWDTWMEEAGHSGAISRDVEMGSQIFYLRTAPVLGRQKRPYGNVVLLTDITSEKKAQARMKLQATALEAVSNGIVITDRNGNIQWANPAFSNLTGYEIVEVIGENPRILKSGVHPKEYYRDLWDTISAGKVWHGEVVNRRKDGTMYDEEMTITPLVRADGSITNFIAIKQDISLRKQAEEAIKDARDEALEASRMKTQLLANVSHDLRTPLGAIMGYAEMLSTGAFGDVNVEQTNACREILDSSNQLVTFINNLIGQAQFESGKLVLRLHPFNPVSLVENIRSSTTYHAKQKGLSLTYEIDPGLPNPLQGDKYWLQQILINLVNNAVKFTNTGGVTARLLLNDPEHWAIQVADTGEGISEEYREKIFAPFEQVDATVIQKGGGFGLGLSIVKQITERMGGRIILDSTPGKGSIFTVILPLQLPQE